jgi:hypothetical protein
MGGINPGNMPVWYTFSRTKQDLPYAIVVYFWTNWTDNSWIDRNSCPNTVNKWECAFLPMTNCTIPKAISNATTQESVSIETRDLLWAVMADKAAYDGNLLIDAGGIDVMKLTDGMGIPSSHQRNIANMFKSHDFYYIMPYDKRYFNKYNPYVAFDSALSVFTYLFMTRPNGYYRSKIKQLLHEMKSRYEETRTKFHTNTPCVAVHIRRGDRVGFRINMTEWCYNATHDNNPENTGKLGCLDIKNRNILSHCPDEISIRDYACNYGTPFGSVTLEAVIDKVRLLVNPIIYNLLVFTDDPIWLDDEANMLKVKNPQWNIFSLKSPVLPSDIDKSTIYDSLETYERAIEYFRFRGHSESGVYFHASLRLAQQCSAFVGHTASGVSSLFFSSMCLHHAGRYGFCPPMYDFRIGLNF